MANKFCEGYFGTPGNFECVTRDGKDPANLVHYWRGNDFVWQPPAGIDPVVITKGATSVDSSGAIVKSTIGQPQVPGRFDVLVLEGSNLVHYYGDRTDSPDTWQQAEPFIVSTAAVAEASFIQSTFKTTPDAPGNFEAVVLEGKILWHYYKDNSNPTSGWVRTDMISTNASTPGCIIQSDLGGQPGIGNFEVVVVEGTNLVHYFRDNSKFPYTWSPQPTATITTTAASSASFIQGNLKQNPSAPGNFELVVLEGNFLDEQKSLVHYWRDNSTTEYKWSLKTAIISRQSQGAPCIIQSGYATPPGNFEVLLVEGAEGAHSLEHYWRDNTKPPPQPWFFGGTVLIFPFDSVNW